MYSSIPYFDYPDRQVSEVSMCIWKWIVLGQKFAYLASVQAGFFNILNYVLKRLNSSIPFGVVKWTEIVFNYAVKRESFLNITKIIFQN